MKIKKGFTIVELLIAIAIITLLAVIVSGGISDWNDAKKSRVFDGTQISDEAFLESNNSHGNFKSVCLDGLELWWEVNDGALIYKRNHFGNLVRCN